MILGFEIAELDVIPDELERPEKVTTQPALFKGEPLERSNTIYE